MAFNQVAGPIAIATVGTEVTLVSVSVEVTEGQNIKIDYALGFEVINTANYNVIAQFRIYRDLTLLNTRILNRVGSQNGTQRFPIASTYVDIAPESATANYSLRAVITTADNITSASGNNINMNLILF